MTATTKKRTAVPMYECLECGKQMTQAQAEHAAYHGCSKCGGSDIDIARTVTK